MTSKLAERILVRSLDNKTCSTLICPLFCKHILTTTYTKQNLEKPHETKSKKKKNSAKANKPIKQKLKN
jgi:hypothetical protein